MGQKKRYQTRLPQDKAEQLDKYRDERDITKSEAVRRLLVRQLETGTAEDTGARGRQAGEIGSADDTDSDTDTDADGFEWTHARVLVAVFVAGFIGTGSWELGAYVGDALTLLGGF